MKPSLWPDRLEDILWAKSAAKGAGGRPESLPQHTWDVLQRLTDFIRLRPSLPESLGMARLWHILFWAAYLHDFGKAAKGFQARLRGGAPWPHRHEVLSLAFVDWVTAGLTDVEKAWLIAAIVTHHKDAEELNTLYPLPDDFGPDPLISRVCELEAPVVQGLFDWVSLCAQPWIDALSLDDLAVAVPVLPDRLTATSGVVQDGARRIRHWLKVFRRLVRQIENSDDSKLISGTLMLRGYLMNADHGASAHAGQLPEVRITQRAIIERLQGAPYRHQLEAARTPGSALLSAPTGSGKTEAALLWAAAQAEQSGRPPRLFYTLPYQASMNAMRLRLNEAFPGYVGLQHGRSLLALYRMLLEQEDYTPAQAAARARWERNLAQLNYPPIRVFSPYQMLKGMYRLKGYEALLSDYQGAIFVFDEIHAYEVERLAMILATMAFLARTFEARFFVMSATFPSLIKRWLHEALVDPTEIHAEHALYESFQRHRLVIERGEILTGSTIQRIINDAVGGRSVLVVSNLVDRAQGIYEALQEPLRREGIPLLLLHGRFNMRDRSSKERVVRETAGACVGKGQPLVLVATQVVEVSLDIDIDTLYSDPAPLEALVQRFGRINRRRKQSDLALVHVFGEPDDGQGIYDELLVHSTISLLEQHAGQPIDEVAIGDWLDEIYSGEVASRWQAAYEHAQTEFEATCVNTLRPFASDYGLEDTFYRAFDSVEVLPQVLAEEYAHLLENDPILASELLVPISWRRYYALSRTGHVTPRQGHTPPVVHASYSTDTGMMFDRK